MLCNENEYTEKIYDNVEKVAKMNLIPNDHQIFLRKMKYEYNIDPKVIYDIGSSHLHWTNTAKNVWNSAEYILFDAFEPVKILYDKYPHWIGVLGDVDNKDVKFYQNDLYSCGNSIYKEIAFDDGKFFPEENYLLKKMYTLDTIVKQNNFPFPELIKIDVQGAEMDILKGSTECLKEAKYLIIELAHVKYNRGAPLAEDTISYLEEKGWICNNPKFCINPSGADADYFFTRQKM